MTMHERVLAHLSNFISTEWIMCHIKNLKSDCACLGYMLMQSIMENNFKKSTLSQILQYLNIFVFIQKLSKREFMVDRGKI